MVAFSLPACDQQLLDRLALSVLRSRGWRPFQSDTGRWHATTGSSAHWSDRSVRAPDAVDADTPHDLAVKAARRTA